MILFALYLLATLDGALCGNRSAAGRSGLINKRRYYFKWMAEGALWAQAASVISGLALLIVLHFAPDRPGLLLDLENAAQRMLRVYIPYTILILSSFIVRAAPSVDIRSATSVLIFGPMTAARPLISLIGVLYGIIPATRWEVRALGLLVLLLMLAVERIIDRRAEGARLLTLTHRELRAVGATENSPAIYRRVDGRPDDRVP